MKKLKASEYHNMIMEFKKTITNWKYINIYEISGWKDEITKVGINWSALGTCESSEAVEFANDLLKAVKFVEEFNKQEYKIVYSEE